MRNSKIELMKERLQQGLTIAKGQGAQGAKISFHQAENIGCQFEAGRLKSTDSRETALYSIEVLVDGKRSSVSGNIIEDLGDMIKRAISLAKVGSAAHFTAYPTPADIPQVCTYAPQTLELSRESLIEYSQTIADTIKSYDPDLFIFVGAGRSEYEKILATTGGVFASSKATSWTLEGYVQRTQGSDMLFCTDSRSWRDANQFLDPDAIAERIIKDLRMAEKLTEAPTGNYPVYLSPEMLYRFISALMMGVNGRNVAKGDSPLRGMLGKNVLDESLTIIDNPHRDFSPGATTFDDDGIPTRTITIFEKGILKSFLYDLDSAGLAGSEPTGNSGCSPYDLEVLAGDESSEDLLTSIKEGIYVKDVLGFGQSNILNGDFSANVGLGYRIENGRISGRVKNTMIAGNLYEILKKNVRLGSERDPLLLLPYAVVEGVTISAAR
ncbi:MAG: TldD/PmbA family protein [bacterium]